MNFHMTAKRNKGKSKHKKTGLYPFRAAVFRGLGVVAPPLLTIVIFFWIGNFVQQELLRPATEGARNILVRKVLRERMPLKKEVPAESLSREDRAKLAALSAEERENFRPVLEETVYEQTDNGAYVPVGYRGLGNGTAIPTELYDEMHQGIADDFLGKSEKPTADDYYRRYVDQKWLNRYLVVPCFLSLFVLTLYLLGKFMAARIGRFFVTSFERGVNQVPLVRNVYGAVKQVSDFFLREREQGFSRVVAVEWPRKGIWSLALVTGESMIDIEAAANEPVMSVLIPTSPVPMTGFALTVKKSETIDLNISIDQAIQFIVSCGVAVPPQQMRTATKSAESQPLIASDDSTGSADN